MRLQILHLSDLHIKNTADSYEINIKKITQVFNSCDIKSTDEFVIVVSGDLAQSGKSTEYKVVSSFIGAMFKEINVYTVAKKRIDYVCVPGNHDLDFDKLNIGKFEMEGKRNLDELQGILEAYSESMKSFFSHANRQNCFRDNKWVSKKVCCVGTHKIGFVMVNSTAMSVLGGTAKDMGNHYLEDESLELIQTATEAEINILVMHHSVEWFYSECKERLRDLIAQKYALVLFGHEHRPIGESRNTNENGAIQFIQGNALRGSTAEGNGFCLITVDCEDNSILAKSFIWKKDFYVSKEILSGEIKRIPIIEFPNDLKFIEYIERNHCQQALNSCFVMPSLSCTKYNKNREPSVCDIESEEELFDIILEYKKIFLSGKHKSGKTTLAKRIYKRYLESGSVPILLYQDNFFKGNFEKLIKHAFEEQYQADDNDYQKFEQLPQNRKIIIVDDADLIVKPILEKLIKFIEGKFGKILIIGENSAQFDIHQQVIDSLVEDRIKLTVKPFLYKKRKMLIKTILNNKSETCKDIENEAQKINELINSQVKIFDLAPEFIMSFVELYENDSKLQYFNGKNVFSLVYESNIVQKINQVVYNTTTEIIINILRELAFRMHFRKHFAITELEIISIVDCYNKTYRQKLSGVTFLDIVLKAKILTNNEGEYRFRDKTLMAYFVARALNNKYQKGEDIQVELDYLLRNLCFNINSDIVLFMALITNNIRFVETIVLKAEEFFDDMEELSFEKRNIKILSIAPIPVKNTLPTIEEKEKRDNNISIQEEKSLNDTLEMTYGYDYVEEDLEKKSNQNLIAYKYIEILAKTLPAFCQEMEISQQDRIVKLIYELPNKFLYMVLKDLEDDLENNINKTLKKASELDNTIANFSLNFEDLKYIYKQIASLCVVAVYENVACTCTTEQSVEALNAFDISDSMNYQLLNLMMECMIKNLREFSLKAKRLDKVSKNKWIKSIVKLVVRNYFLKHNITMYKEAQSLGDYFFEPDTKKELFLTMVKDKV